MAKVTELKDIKEQKDYLRYSRDVVHTHSPAAQKLINLALHHFDLAFEEGRKGKKVVWNNSFCTQIIYACKAIPLGLPDLGRYGNASSVAEAEKFFQIPAETCAMIKSIVGGLYQFRNEPCGKIISNGTRCEPELTALSTISRYGYDVYIMDIYSKPLGENQERLKLVRKSYEREIEQVVQWLTGTELDKESLRQELIRANRVHRKVQTLCELQKKHISYYKTIPTFLAMTGAENYFGQPELFEEIIDEMTEEITSLPEDSYNEQLVDVVWSGLRGVDFSVYNAVDIAGGHVVGWNLPTSIYDIFDTEIDPVEAVLQKALSGKAANGMEAACAYDEKLVRDSGAKGVILYSTLGCTQHTIDTETKRIYLNEKQIPTLVLAGTAQIGEITGQVMTRLKAFMEMLS